MIFHLRFGHQDKITGIDAGLRERAVTSGGRDGSVRIWKIVEESQLVFNGPASSIDSVKLINEDHFVTCGEDGCVTFVVHFLPNRALFHTNLLFQPSFALECHEKETVMHGVKCARP